MGSGQQAVDIAAPFMQLGFGALAVWLLWVVVRHMKFQQQQSVESQKEHVQRTEKVTAALVNNTAALKEVVDFNRRTGDKVAELQRSLDRRPCLLKDGE